MHTHTHARTNFRLHLGKTRRLKLRVHKQGYQQARDMDEYKATLIELNHHLVSVDHANSMKRWLCRVLQLLLLLFFTC